MPPIGGEEGTDWRAAEGVVGAGATLIESALRAFGGNLAAVAAPGKQTEEWKSRLKPPRAHIEPNSAPSKDTE